MMTDRLLARRRFRFPPTVALATGRDGANTCGLKAALVQVHEGRPSRPARCVRSVELHPGFRYRHEDRVRGCRDRGRSFRQVVLYGQPAILERL
jgi:hypothetical protein